MLRLLGALLISASSLALGLSYVAGESRKLSTLRSVLQLLREMRGELETRLTPLPELLEYAAGRCSGAGKDFAVCLMASLPQLGEREFFQLWDKGVAACLAGLDSEDRETLQTLGRSLGRFELDRQLADMDACIETLENRAVACSSTLPEKKRLGLGMACSFGALLLIVLI